MPFVRLEILLPLRYNDGTPIESEKLEETREELLAYFDAVSLEPAPIHGIWIIQRTRFEDESVRLFVDCEDSKRTRQFIHEMKERLKLRFDQLDIWITVHKIEII